MPSHDPVRCRRRVAHAFTLVEVALALGIAGFVLVGLIGAIPLASSVSQQSIAQSRAASIAGTIFTNIRAQKFNAASLADDASDALNLDTLTTGSGPSVYYVYFDETLTSAVSSTDERRLHFLTQKPPATSTAGPTNNPVYQVTMRFNNNPAGTLAPYPTTASPTVKHAQANAVEVSIYALAHPKEVYRFSSVVANRAE